MSIIRDAAQAILHTNQHDAHPDVKWPKRFHDADAIVRVVAKVLSDTTHADVYDEGYMDGLFVASTKAPAKVNPYRAETS